MVEDSNNNGNNAINLVPEANRALWDYVVPLLQGASLRNLETQVGQLANSINNRPQDSLPSDTQINPKSKEQCQAITLRSEKKIKGVNEKAVEPETEHVDKEGMCEKESEIKQKEDDKAENQRTSQVIHSPPPFPQRLQKQKLEKQFQKFLNVFKKLHINIPFAEALEQMPNYVKFLKDILSKKRKLSEFEIVSLIGESSAILQNKLPPKLKDPGSFTIPYTIGNLFFAKASSDLGASINLMLWSIFEKLGLGECKPTFVTLQLADRSYVYPKGIIEYVLVKVDKFIFPVNFKILDMEEDRKIPIILGKPFLAIARALIDVEKSSLMPTFKPYIEEPSTLELKPLPAHLRYAFLGKFSTFPVIISTSLTNMQEKKLLWTLREFKKAIGWTIADIKGISPSVCMHKILLEENHKATIEQ
ncbi:PREDICTED: uncharacterized protein LOC108663249 [Theobroma cacao]|uniref:Uncharacterized protein LOC108663249 n=1 Tax=Theobroma cacao TaxID=3641 RepID=A0AB32WSP6_THECC|nr:PREDICTED: uncharacterized protein LOC108663249 [Theobroma cacao]